MQAPAWNRKALLGSFEKSPSLLPHAVVFPVDRAFFGAGTGWTAHS
jgi:hypothetical protein